MSELQPGLKVPRVNLPDMRMRCLGYVSGGWLGGVDVDYACGNAALRQAARIIMYERFAYFY